MTLRFSRRALSLPTALTARRYGQGAHTRTYVRKAAATAKVIAGSILVARAGRTGGGPRRGRAPPLSWTAHAEEPPSSTGEARCCTEAGSTSRTMRMIASRPIALTAVIRATPAPVGAMGQALPSDAGIEDRDARGLRRDRRDLYPDARVDEGPWAGAGARRGASFPSFPRGHEAPWVSASREMVLPCSFLAFIRPHGHTTSGRVLRPCACLPFSMRPHGRPRSVNGAILCPAWVPPWGSMTVRIARSSARFTCIRTPITLHGCAHDVGWVHASERRGHPWMDPCRERGSP